MNIVIWLLVGGLIGWLASVILRNDGRQGILMNVLIGILGAAVSGWLLTPRLGGATINQGDFSVAGVLISLVGAVVLLGIVSLFRRGAAR
jgi:uncharacterized membrane protein YeaQ/YmgE (transglycosylase-associated protein family)